MSKTTFDGWTLIGPDGEFVLCGGTPLFWKNKRDAEDCREGEMKTVRAKLALLRAAEQK